MRYLFRYTRNIGRVREWHECLLPLKDCVARAAALALAGGASETLDVAA